jgi:Restriction endonuclease S subunits
MSEWKRCTLADIGEIVGGATPSTKNESYYGGDIAWITPKDLSTFQGRFISHGERNITIEGLNNCSARLMPPHSVLFTSRAPIGYVAISENEVCTNQGFKSIVPNETTDSLFLYYLLLYNRDKIENMGSGTTFKEVSGTIMKQFEIKIPATKRDQQVIARILCALDDKIENNAKINHHLAQMAQAIFKKWFVDFEPWGGVMPKDWNQGVLGDICDYNSERIAVALLTCGTYISTENISAQKMGFVTASSLPAITQTTAFKAGDTLVSNIRPYFKKLVYCDFSGGCSTDVLCFRPRGSVFALFLYNLLYSDKFFDYMIGGSKGTKMPRGDKQQIMNYPIVIPNNTILEKFVALVSPFMEQSALQKTENLRLTTLRDTLLPRLMSGELSVADL